MSTTDLLVALAKDNTLSDQIKGFMDRINA
jgi:hypothetical protein